MNKLITGHRSSALVIVGSTDLFFLINGDDDDVYCLHFELSFFMYFVVIATCIIFDQTKKISIDSAVWFCIYTLQFAFLYIEGL